MLIIRVVEYPTAMFSDPDEQTVAERPWPRYAVVSPISSVQEDFDRRDFPHPESK
jgi:hypothetical protein